MLNSDVAGNVGGVRRAHLWVRRCLVTGALLTGPSAFILHPPLYDPTTVEPVIKDVAESGSWQWLHVVAMVGGILIVGGYTLWAWSLSERRRLDPHFYTGPAAYIILALSWMALTLWLPLVTFEAAGLPRVARFLVSFGSNNQLVQGLVQLVHALWSTMLATAYLIAALSGVAALILTEAEIRGNARTGHPAHFPLWLRILAWLAGLGAVIILPIAWGVPKVAPLILAPPGVAYFGWAICAGLRMGKQGY